jgi:hypothetical protein
MSAHNAAVDPEKLGVILAARLGAIVPAGFHVRASDGMLWYSADQGRSPGGHYAGSSGTYVRDNFDAYDDDSDVDRAAYIARRALDELQGYMDQATHEPWPGKVTPPKPYAQIRGEMLHLWYGGPDIEDAAVLSCEPIPLTSLQPDEGRDD